MLGQFGYVNVAFSHLVKNLSSAGTSLTELIIDSGTTWSICPSAKYLVNIRDCLERIVSADKTAITCLKMGDMPCAFKDSNGGVFFHTIKDVRIVPEYSDILISVNALWETMGIDVRFGGTKSLIFPNGTRVPFTLARMACTRFRLSQTQIVATSWSTLKVREP